MPVGIAHRHPRVTAILELVLDLGEVVGDLIVELVPVRAGVGRAVEIDQRPVGIGGQAVERRDVALEMADGEGRRGLLGHVDRYGAVGDAVFVVDDVDHVVAVLVGADDAAADGAGLVQRPTDVEFGALGIPRPVLALDGAAPHLRRLLQRHVDGAGRLAGAAEQAGRPPEDLDVVDDGEIGLGAVDARKRRRQPVEIQGIELEAAGKDAGAAVVVVEDDDALRLAQGGVERGVAPVLDPLPGQNGGRLRNFARRPGFLLADTDQVGCVAVRSLRLVARPVDNDGVELDGGAGALGEALPPGDRRHRARRREHLEQPGAVRPPTEIEAHHKPLELRAAPPPRRVLRRHT